MKNVLLCIGLLSVVGISCKRSVVEPPLQSLLPIEGTYQAKYYNPRSGFSNEILYPINGQQLTLQIKYVSTDTVSVQITPSASTSALPNGVFSPTQTLVYPKAYVESSATSASYIYLAGKKGAQVSPSNPQIWIYRDTQSADYFFYPQQTANAPHDVRFEKN